MKKNVAGFDGKIARRVVGLALRGFTKPFNPFAAHLALVNVWQSVGLFLSRLFLRPRPETNGCLGG